MMMMKSLFQVDIKIHYYSSQSSHLQFYLDWDKYLSAMDRMEDDERFRIGYTRIPLESNKYFSGIPVNTNTSVVHVPTNVFDGGNLSIHS